MTNREHSDILEFIENNRKAKHYQPGQIIFSQGEQANEFFYLKRGLGHVYTVTEDGSERNILIAWPGRFFGASTFFNHQNRQSSAIALKECEVLCIDRELYLRCVEKHPGFQEALLLELSKDLVVMFEQLADSSLFDSDINVARFICRRLATAQPAGGEHPVVKYTQELIATLLGLSRWSVNRALSIFKENGWVQLDRGRITVLQVDAIRRFAYDQN